MFEALKARLPGREGFTFIRRDNTASLKVHTKMGMNEVAVPVCVFVKLLVRRNRIHAAPKRAQIQPPK